MKKINTLGIAGLLFLIFSISSAAYWSLSFPYWLLISFIIFCIAAGILVLIKRVEKSQQIFIDFHKQLQKSEQCFREAFDQAAIGIGLVSPRGRYLKVNHVLCQILGYSQNELLHMSIRHLVHPDDFTKDLPYILNMLKGEYKTYQSIGRYFNKAGEIVWIMLHVSLVTNNDKQPQYFIVQFQNISNERKSQEQLQHMAYHDPLTGLANRNRLEQYLDEIITSARRGDENFAIILLDLDFFKNINDSIGHDAGDLLLQIVAERLKNTVRSKDMVARIGGDEFVIVITDAKKAEYIAQIAQKILDNLLKPISLLGREVYITTSIGISLYPYDGQDIETLIKNADLALYRVKEFGRNSYQFCTPDMTQKAKEKIDKRNALKHALLKDEFILHYQPVQDMRTKNITNLEALLRWQSKEYGLVAPDTVIAIAEESGLIVPLSEWILRTACKQVKAWQEAGHSSLKLSINLSARQFKNPDFIKGILQILESTQFSPRSLVLEITEGLIMHDPENTLKILGVLKEAGICIAIDDFGTGFSSFSYLTNYAVDHIKIDKTFIRKLSMGSTTLAIVSAMIAMANKLGIKSVAEGVETKEQYEILEREGCNEAQGYYIAKPLSVEGMTEFLTNKTSLNFSFSKGESYRADEFPPLKKGE